MGRFAKIRHTWQRSRVWTWVSVAAIGVPLLIIGAVLASSRTGHGSHGDPVAPAATNTSLSRSVMSSVRMRIEIGKVISYRSRTGVGCVRSTATGHATGCGFILVPNHDSLRVGDMVNAVVGTAPYEDNNHWKSRKVVLINAHVVHG